MTFSPIDIAFLVVSIGFSILRQSPSCRKKQDYSFPNLLYPKVTRFHYHDGPELKLRSLGRSRSCQAWIRLWST
jgi:hypothetical protein